VQTKSKIEAFTLSEMVVVLILTSIVVGLAFSVLSLVQRHMAGVQANFIKNTELNKLEQSLWLGFNRYSNIEYNDIEDELIFINEMDTIKYQFQQGVIVKELDTFHVQLQNKTFFFDGQQVIIGTVDAIKLETSKATQSQHLFIFKDNDATTFINNGL
jgi:type II secretory pathway component PulJ